MKGYNISFLDEIGSKYYSINEVAFYLFHSSLWSEMSRLFCLMVKSSLPL